MPRLSPKRRPRLAETKAPYRASRDRTATGVPTWEVAPHLAAAAFAAAVYVIEGVTAVYAKQTTDGTLDLWTVTDRDDFDLLKLVYDEEARLYEAFPGLRIDFYDLSSDHLRNKPAAPRSEFTVIPRAH
jgi:hypothetical protein